MIYSINLQSPLGPLIISADSCGITSITLDQLISPPLKEFIPKIIPSNYLKHLILARNELTEYFNKKRTSFSFNKHLKGTPFQKKVWSELEKIPFGYTLSYSELAKNIKIQKAARAVGNAVHNNPIFIALPCHRIILKNGKIGGFAQPIRIKHWLLRHESGTLF